MFSSLLCCCYCCCCCSWLTKLINSLAWRKRLSNWTANWKDVRLRYGITIVRRKIKTVFISRDVYSAGHFVFFYFYNSNFVFSTICSFNLFLHYSSFSLLAIQMLIGLVFFFFLQFAIQILLITKCFFMLFKKNILYLVIKKSVST